MARPGATITETTGNEEENDLELNRLSPGQPVQPTVQSQSDVPAGAIGQGVAGSWLLLVPAMLLALLSAWALR